MDRRLLVGLAVLGVAVAVAVGILLLGGDDGSDGGTGTDTNSALSNDERPDPSGDGGSGGGGDKDENGDGSGGGRDGGGQGGGEDGDGSDPDHSGPPVEQDPPGGGGGGNQPQGDPADVAAVTDVLTTYLQAIAAGDGDTACAQLSPSGETTMLKKIAKAAPETKGAPCAQAILLYQGAYGESASDPTFKNIVVSGSSATAVGPLREPARLSVTGGEWLIDEYGQ